MTPPSILATWLATFRGSQGGDRQFGFYPRRVSVVSALEIGTKVKIGRLELARPVADGFDKTRSAAGIFHRP
jgi:hypothetical protein